MVDRVEEGLDVGVEDVAVALRVGRLERSRGAGAGEALAVGVGAVLEQRLDRLAEHLRHRPLRHPIAHRGDRQRADAAALLARQQSNRSGSVEIGAVPLV